jgi:hypothetical protein
MGKHIEGTEKSRTKKGKQIYYLKKKQELLSDPDYKFKRQKWYSENKIKIHNTTRKSYYKLKYGITLEQFNAIRDSQESKCKICGIYKPLDAGNGGKIGDCLHVDHCHKTGKIRGLLCSNCNVGLGNFQDTPEFLIKASDYLKNNGNQVIL